MRYVPLASPALLARHAAGDVVDLSAMPMMRYNAKDDLQRLALSGAGLDVEDVRAGRLVRVPGLDDVLVPLYWQAATLPVTRLVRLTRAVREAAQRTLEPG
ncbi:chromosome replication initiation inhibitor protein [Micrococcus luteus]|nr:chromosome replication initiation inhibitor protein [Micrococcus luteus]